MNSVMRQPDGRNEPEDTLTMLKTPDLWTLSAVLPLMNRQRDQEGVAVSRPGVPRTWVFLLNLYDERMRDLLTEIPPPSDLPHEEYADFEAIIDAGWRVD